MPMPLHFTQLTILRKHDVKHVTKSGKKNVRENCIMIIPTSSMSQLTSTETYTTSESVA